MERDIHSGRQTPGQNLAYIGMKIAEQKLKKAEAEQVEAEVAYLGVVEHRDELQVQVKNLRAENDEERRRLHTELDKANKDLVRRYALRQGAEAKRLHLLFRFKEAQVQFNELSGLNDEEG